MSYCEYCNAAGTESCNKVLGECSCLERYTGNYCSDCKYRFDYVDASGHCRRCPCQLELSDGTCFYDSRQHLAVCSKCNAGFAGYECTVCALGYTRLHNGTCRIDSAMEIRNHGSAEPIIIGLTSTGLIFFLLLALLFLLFQKHVRSKRRRCNTGSERVLLLETEFLNDIRRDSDEFDSNAPFDYDAMNPLDQISDKTSSDNTPIDTSQVAGLKRNPSSYYFISTEDATIGQDL